MLHELITKFDIAQASCYNRLDVNLPTELYESYQKSLDKVNLCIKANKIAQCSLTTENIPTHIVEKLNNSQEAIIQYVKKNKLVEKNKLTKYYLKALILERYFDSQTLNISDFSYSNKISYRFLAERTLRSAHKENSLKVMTLPKEKRSLILPHNDFFVELDYNSADLRSVFACLNLKQPETDIYEFIRDKFHLKYDRNELKVKVLSWLHSGDYFDELEKVFKREILLKKHYDGTYLTNLFGFKIECEEKKAVGYLAQSTTSVIFLESLYNVLKYIDSHKLKTKVSLCIHDSILLDVDKTEVEEIRNIKKLYGQTKFGDFLVKLKVGRNYGEMK